MLSTGLPPLHLLAGAFLIVMDFCYDWGMRLRLGYTYTKVEEPIVATSLAKRDIALHELVAKWRHRGE